MAKSGYAYAEIGERLIALREATGYGEHGGQSEFAHWLGFSPSQLNNWESGLKRPSMDNALKICRMTGATLDWIYTGSRAGLPVSLANDLPGPHGDQRKAG